MDHEELIREMVFMDTMLVADRLHLAKKRRKFQLDNYYKKSNIDDMVKKGNKKRRDTSLRFSTDVQIMEAVTKGDLKEMELLLKQGVNPNIPNYELLTPLHQCCIEGYVDMANILLENGANVNARDMDGWTPLHAAATCGHKDIVELLVRAGADLLAINTDEDMPFEITDDEDTLVLLEREMTYQGITEQIVVEKGRHMHSLLKRDILNTLRDGADLNEAVMPDGATFLHVAIGNFYNDLVKALLKYDASDEVVDEDGWRPIHVAAYWGNDEAFTQLVKQRNSDIEVKTSIGENCYDLCEDPDLKIYIKKLLIKRNIKSNGYVNDIFDLDSTGMNKPQFNIGRRRSWSRRASVDDLVNSINPLFNPDASERASERKTSFRGTKKYTPNSKSHPATDWDILEEEIEPPTDLQSKTNKKIEVNIISNHYDELNKGNVNLGFEEENHDETNVSGNETSNLSIDVSNNHEEKSNHNHEDTTNYHNYYKDEINNLNHKDETHNLNNLIESSKPFITIKNITEESINESSTDPITNNGSTPTTNPPPNKIITNKTRNSLINLNHQTSHSHLPKNSLCYLKKRRSQERELKLQTRNRDMEAERKVVYEKVLPKLTPPQSPTAIRYSFKETDIAETLSINIKKKKCCLM